MCHTSSLTTILILWRKFENYRNENIPSVPFCSHFSPQSLISYMPWPDCYIFIAFLIDTHIGHIQSHIAIWQYGHILSIKSKTLVCSGPQKLCFPLLIFQYFGYSKYKLLLLMFMLTSPYFLYTFCKSIVFFTSVWYKESLEARLSSSLGGYPRPGEDILKVVHVFPQARISS